MKKILHDMVKGAVVFAAVGLVLAFLSPPVATMLGAHLLGAGLFHSLVMGTYEPILWTSLFFGGFGAMVPPVQKLWDMVFGPDKNPTGDTVAALQTKVDQLDGREQTIEQALANVPSRAVQTILAAGPRHQGSFTDAEQKRAATQEQAPTLH